MADGGSKRRPLVTAAVAFALLAVGAVIALYLVRTREAPERRPAVADGELVEVREVAREPARLDVEGWGTVLAAQVLEVRPQITGRLEWVNEQLTPGGVIEAGEPLYRIERRDHELAVRARRNALAEARTQLRLERNRQQVAEREWEMFQETFGTSEDADPDLATREPQLEAARVAVEAARAELDRARLDLDRTVFRSPMDAYVRAEDAEVGKLVTPNEPLATLVGTDSFWVEVAIPADQVGLVDVAAVGSGGGATARIEHQGRAGLLTREGKVVRLLGDLEERGRMARVLIEIRDPFGLEQDGDAPPLLAGSYVRAVIEGAREVPLIEVPRAAMHGSDQAYVFVQADRSAPECPPAQAGDPGGCPGGGQAGILDIREVEVVWRREHSVLVGAGLEDGDRVVVSPIARPVDGMRLRAIPADRGPQARAGAGDG